MALGAKSLDVAKRAGKLALVVAPAALLVANVTGTISIWAYMSQVFQTVDSFGGTTFVFKVAAIITLIISSFKVSFLNDLVWSKFGKFQAALAPLLGLIAGVLNLQGTGALNVKGVLAYMVAGAGAVALHELLDMVKAIPGLGTVWVNIINFIESVAGGPTSAAGN